MNCEKEYCCCKCSNHIKLSKHPWNIINNGRISEDTGMIACILEHDIDKSNKVVLFESQHGECELFVKIDSKK